MKAIMIATTAVILIAASFVSPMPAAAIEEVKVCPGSGNSGVSGSWFVNFDTGKATIRSEDRKELNEAAKQAKGRYVQVICVIGRADKRGSPAANEALSRKRARAVAEYLVSRGVKSNTLLISARGEAFGENIFGSIVSAEDRRVEVKFIK